MCDKWKEPFVVVVLRDDDLFGVAFLLEHSNKLAKEQFSRRRRLCQTDHEELRDHRIDAFLFCRRSRYYWRRVEPTLDASDLRGHIAEP